MHISEGQNPWKCPQAHSHAITAQSEYKYRTQMRRLPPTSSSQCSLTGSHYSVSISICLVDLF